MQGIKRRVRSLKVLIILISFLMLTPLNVLAEDPKVINEFDGSKVASPGETIVYDVKVNANVNIKKYDTILIYDSSVLDIISIENRNDWKGNNIPGSSPLTISYTRDNGIGGWTVVAKITFKVKSDTTKSSATIKLDAGTAESGDEEIIPVEESVFKIDIKSTDNTLKSLNVNNRPVNNFSSNTYTYTIQVESNVQKVKIDAVLNSTTAAFVKDFGPRTVDVDYGETELLVKVKSASGAEKVYTIIITRLDTRENNNFLKSLIINSGKIKIDFDKERAAYSIKTYRQKTIEVDAVSEDGKATVVVDKPEELVLGSNTVKVKVTAESGAERVYTLTIDNVDANINTALRVLSVDGYVIDFYEKTLDYNIRYNSKYKNGLNIIKAAVLDEYSGVRIDEGLLSETNKNLKPGSAVKIRVYFDDQYETIYTINIVRDTRINFFLILGIIVLIVLVVVLIRVIKKRKKEKMMAEKTLELSKTKEIKIDKSYKE